jgi:hypothetical protein
MRTKLVLPIILILLYGNQLCAQARGDSCAFGFLSIQTTANNSIALVDAKTVLALPVDSARLTPGSHRVRVENVTQWDAQVMDTSIVVAADAVCVITIPEKHTYTFLSEPSGALVSVQDKALGVTPLRVTTDRVLSLPLALSLSHFEKITLEPPLAPVSRVRFYPDGASQTDRMFESSRSIRNYSEWIYGSIATGILSATVSALAKNKADNYDNRFRATGNPSLHDKSNTFDLIAGSALLITEISFGALSYLLVTQ